MKLKPKRWSCKITYFRGFLLGLLVWIGWKLWKSHSPISLLENSTARLNQILESAHANFQSDATFFKPTVYIKPSTIGKSGKTFFDQDTAAQIAAASLSLNHFRLDGLAYCSMLNGALFRADVFIHPLGGSVIKVNPTGSQLALLMDREARKVYSFLLDRLQSVHPEEAKRLACYTVAQGNSPLSNWSDVHFLETLNHKKYFAQQLPALSSAKSTIPGARRKYKIAYLILVQDSKSLSQLGMLLDVIDDGEALVLLQVDRGQPTLINRIQALLDKRELKNRKAWKSQGNVFMTKTGFTLIYGHISAVFAHLNGFFELLDMADWDYVINLSMHDWPLRKNAELHRILELRGKMSWIDMWSNSQIMSSLLFRPHLGVNNASIEHSLDFGIRGWPFPNWRTFIQSPWMILTRDAASFFRSSPASLDYLAFLEATLEPQKTFFGTALMNSPAYQNLVYREKRRYDREPGSGGATWIGWADRHIFPPGEKEPRYLFFRPFNALGAVYDESKLVRWVQRNHLEMGKNGHECVVSQIGTREECLRAFAEKIAKDNHVILVPVNKAFLALAANLRCSLAQRGMNNVIHWALDSEAHDELIEAGHLSLYIPHSQGSSSLSKPGSKGFKEMMRQKPAILLKLINAGFHIWSLDADTIVMGDFEERGRKYAADPYRADIMLAMNEPQRIESAFNIGKRIPSLDMGILYLRNSVGAKTFLENLQKKLDSHSGMDDAEAMDKVVNDDSLVSVTGMGISKDDLYPSAGLSDDTHSKEATKEEASPPVQPARANSNHGFSSLFSLRAPRTIQDALEADRDKRTRMHILDQLEYVSGKLYFDHSSAIPAGFHGYRIIHASGQEDSEKSLRSKGHWFVDTKGQCISKKVLTVFTKKVARE